MNAQLSPEEVTAICTAAQAAWDGATAKATHVPFKWKGKPYVASHSSFRLTVDTPDRPARSPADTTDLFSLFPQCVILGAASR